MSDILGDRSPAGYSFGAMIPSVGEPPDNIGPYIPTEKELRSTFGSWAIMIEDVYSITGRGIVLSGKTLYGKPKPSTINIGDQMAAECSGIECYCISYWWYPGSVVGVLIGNSGKVYKNGKLTEVEFTKDMFTRGTAVIGG